MATTVRRAMAKKKARKPEGPRDEPVISILHFKGRPDFKAWVERLRDHVRLPAQTMFEHALIELAKSRGFDEKPPKRAP